MPQATRQRGTILVVEDESSIRELVCELLREAGFHTLHAADGSAGLRILRSETRIDLLITDVGLPGLMNGRQMADAARSVRPDLRVLFVTGYAEHSVVGDGHLEPGMHLLTKPFSLDVLRQKIHDILAG
jgi:CheY-like chemotaxis protein